MILVYVIFVVILFLGSMGAGRRLLIDLEVVVTREISKTLVASSSHAVELALFEALFAAIDDLNLSKVDRSLSAWPTPSEVPLSQWGRYPL